MTRDERVEKIIVDFLASRQVAQSRIITTEVDNTGSRIMENGVERNYLNEGWLQS